MTTPFRIDPRIRAYGKARIDVTRRARDEREWQTQWREPRYPFPFRWEGGWRHCIQYTVDDFAAEIGFYIDVLGFPVNAFSPSYAQFTSPDQAFFFAVAAIQEGAQSTPFDSLRMQFMVEDLPATIEELEKRNISFERKPESDEVFPAIAILRSPHGIGIELWGVVRDQPRDATHEMSEEDDTADFWADDDEVEDEVDEQEADDTQDDAEQPSYEGIGDGELVDEPVYVDEDEAGQKEPLHPIAANLTDGSSRSIPSLPRAVIRRTEDLLKGGVQFPVRKVRGNGFRNQKLLDVNGDPGE